MKKRNLLYAALILSVVIALNSCFHHHHDGILVRINDNEDEYRMRAHFDDDLTDEVNRVINTYLERRHPSSLVYQNTDREIQLDNGTVVYIKSRPGRLNIEIDKDANPAEGYKALLEMCDEIKEVLANRDENN
jgi:hypothetical protein